LQSAQLKRETGIGQTKYECIFSRCLNVSSEGLEVMREGKSFQIHAPATGKARRPTVESLTAGTNRLPVLEDRRLVVVGTGTGCIDICIFKLLIVCIISNKMHVQQARSIQYE